MKPKAEQDACTYVYICNCKYICICLYLQAQIHKCTTCTGVLIFTSAPEQLYGSALLAAGSWPPHASRPPCAAPGACKQMEHLLWFGGETWLATGKLETHHLFGETPEKRRPCSASRRKTQPRLGQALRLALRLALRVALRLALLGLAG